MKCVINGTTFDYRKNFQDNKDLRYRLNRLAGETFGGLSFEKWYEQGFWTEKTTPYALFDDNNCVANIFATVFHVIFQKEEKTYIQLGTVMTAPAYRNRGLSRFLMHEILKEWKDDCDAVYLYANDRAVDFYPKFGFTEVNEYQYSRPISARTGSLRKLNIEDPADRAILIQKIQCGNPFASVAMPGSTEIVMFHCIMSQKDNLYFLPEYDAVVVAQQEGDTLLCYDAFCGEDAHPEDILSATADEHCRKVCLGFTPKDNLSFGPAVFREEDTHLFVLQEKDNIFRDNLLMFPMLCHT